MKYEHEELMKAFGQSQLSHLVYSLDILAEIQDKNLAGIDRDEHIQDVKEIIKDFIKDLRKKKVGKNCNECEKNNAHCPRFIFKDRAKLASDFGCYDFKKIKTEKNEVKEIKPN